MNLMDIFVSVGFKFDQSGIQSAESAMKRFEKTAESINFMGFLAKITAVRYAFNAVMWAAQSAIGVFTNFIQAAGEKQQIEISFEVLTGSPAKAKKTLEELWDLATKTPFTVPDVEKNAMMLTAMGFAPEDLKQTMSMLGDITAGLPNATLERLALNLGQVKATTYLTGRELRDFANAGVPMLAELQKLEKFKKMSLGEIRDAISDRQVAYEDVEQVFKNLTREGGRFFEMSKKIMQTVPGMWSNLQDQIILLKRAIGERLTPTALALMEAVVTFFNKYKDQFAKVIGETLDALLLGLKTIGLELLGIGRFLVWIFSLIGEYKDIIKGLTSAVVIFGTGKGLEAVGVGFAKIFHKLNVIFRLVRLWVNSAIFLGATGMLMKLTAAIKAAGAAAIVGALPWVALGAAVVLALLAIQDLYKYFTDSENTDTVFGKLAEISPLVKTILDSIKWIVQLMAGLLLLLFTWESGPLKEVVDKMLIKLGEFFGLEGFDLDHIIKTWTDWFDSLLDVVDNFVIKLDKKLSDTIFYDVLKGAGNLISNSYNMQKDFYNRHISLKTKLREAEEDSLRAAASSHSVYYKADGSGRGTVLAPEGPNAVSAGEAVKLGAGVVQYNNIYVNKALDPDAFTEIFKKLDDGLRTLKQQVPNKGRK